MKSGSHESPNSPNDLLPVENALLVHLMTHGLTTSNVWDVCPLLKPFSRKAVGEAVRKFVKLKFLLRGELHHGRFYFVFSPESVKLSQPGFLQSGLLNEPMKLVLYTRLLLTCQLRHDLKPTPPDKILKQFGEELRLQFRSFLLNNATKSIAFVRVDNRVQSRPARSAQVIRGDILRFAKISPLAAMMKRQHFEYVWITTTQPRAVAVLEHFRKYARVGKSPITIIVMPQLMPLLVGIPIHKEILNHRTIT